MNPYELMARVARCVQDPPKDGTPEYKAWALRHIDTLREVQSVFPNSWEYTACKRAIIMLSGTLREREPGQASCADLRRMAAKHLQPYV